MILLSSGREQRNATTTNRGSSAHKQNHPGPQTHRKVGELHTPVPLRTGTQERDCGTERTPSGNHQKHGSPQGQTNDAHGN
ncbi:hypothetical protein Taro_054091 [Colocasia esculenta]|uniref:Uncharacterized protein n=1 Tax=Colocasia esculenta TaxID=4460 RepID=A0A843XPN6_COLES|nr:hypothetical protein [Colocasia esculenta]